MTTRCVSRQVATPRCCQNKCRDNPLRVKTGCDATLPSKTIVVTTPVFVKTKVVTTPCVSRKLSRLFPHVKTNVINWRLAEASRPLLFNVCCLTRCPQKYDLGCICRSGLSPHNSKTIRHQLFQQCLGWALGCAHDYSVINCMSYCLGWAILPGE